MDFPGMYLITISLGVAFLIGSHIVAARFTGSKRVFSIIAFASLLIGSIGWTASVYLESNSDSANFAGSRIVLLAQSLTAPGFLVGFFIFTAMIALAIGIRRGEASPKRETLAEKKAREAQEQSDGLETLGLGTPEASGRHR